jgi:hypothetical protein
MPLNLNILMIRAYTLAMNILGIDHVNIAAPEAVIARCRTFYVEPPPSGETPSRHRTGSSSFSKTPPACASS